MVTAAVNLPALSPAEQTELEQLEKSQDQIVQGRQALDGKVVIARADLEDARRRHREASLAIASGQKADLPKWVGEIDRLEGLIDGYQQLIDQKTADLGRLSARGGELIEKRTRLEVIADVQRRDEEIRTLQAKVKRLRTELEETELAVAAALRARNSASARIW